MDDATEGDFAWAYCHYCHCCPLHFPSSFNQVVCLGGITNIIFVFGVTGKNAEWKPYECINQIAVDFLPYVC